MLPKGKRLSRANFPTFTEGSRLTSEHFSYVYGSGKEGVAVVVPKKIEKSSVGRHALKRRVFAVLHTLPIHGFLVVHARQGAGNLSYDQLKEELLGVFSKIYKTEVP